MVYRNNAGRLGAGFISLCLKTRWLGHFGGFYVPGWPYSLMYRFMYFHVVCILVSQQPQTCTLKLHIHWAPTTGPGLARTSAEGLTWRTPPWGAQEKRTGPKHCREARAQSSSMICRYICPPSAPTPSSRTPRAPNSPPCWPRFPLFWIVSCPFLVCLVLHFFQRKQCSWLDQRLGQRRDFRSMTVKALHRRIRTNAHKKSKRDN